MGITSHMLNQRRAQEAAGKPTPAAPRPRSLLIEEHDRIVNELRSVHQAEVDALRRRVAQLEQQAPATASPQAENPAAGADEQERQAAKKRR